jgi:hypothetical protein
MSAACIFCDDVRQEANAKQTFVGVYRADLVVPRFPFDIARLFLVIRLRAPLNFPVPRKMAVRVEIPEQNDQSFETPDLSDTSTSIGEQAKTVEGFGDRTWELTFVVPFGFKCSSEGRVKVFVETPDSSIFAGGIGIRREKFDETEAAMGGILSTVSHFTLGVPNETELDRQISAAAMYSVLAGLLEGKSVGVASEPDSHFLFAAKSPYEFFVMYREPTFGNRKLRISHHGTALPYEVVQSGPYWSLVRLTDQAGPAFQDGLEVAFQP